MNYQLNYLLQLVMVESFVVKIDLFAVEVAWSVVANFNIINVGDR